MRDGEVREDGDATGDPLAAALTQTVREAGYSVARDPRRVQAMVSDLLGESSQRRRGDIRAVVVAAEVGIPDDLLARRIDGADAVERLREQGFGPEVAALAVRAWSDAFGVPSGDAPAPRPAMGPPHAGVTELAVGVTTSLSTSVTDDEHAGPGRAHRVSRIVVPIAVACLVGAITAMVWRGSQTPTPASTTSTAGTSGTSEPIVFAVEHTALGDLTRTWTLENGELLASLVFANTHEVDLSGWFYEYIPKEVAPTADDISSTPDHQVIKKDPVIAWDLALPPESTYEIDYRIDVADDADDADLAKWERLQVAGAAARYPPPALEVTTPDGLMVPNLEVVLTGTAEPTSTVVANSVRVPVAPDGTWSQHFFLQPGINQITVTAQDRYGRQRDPVVVTVIALNTVPSTTTGRPNTTTTVRHKPPSTTSPSTTVPSGSTSTSPSSTSVAPCPAGPTSTTAGPGC